MQKYAKITALYIVFCINAVIWWAEVDFGYAKASSRRQDYKRNTSTFADALRTNHRVYGLRAIPCRTHKKDIPFGMSFLWWAEVDSNHRSRRRQIYSLIHLAALESAHLFCVALFCCGAGDWTRTHNLLITNQLLCQLSYTGVCLVPWGGIEPPTGRFSVCCSTD